MQYVDIFVSHYGWQGVALAIVIISLFGVQIWYYTAIYSRLAAYKNARRQQILDGEPPISVVIPMFSEDMLFVENALMKFLAQIYHKFQVVIVYVGYDNDFYEELVRLKQEIPNLETTKIEYNPRFPISIKMALNVGIKSAAYEHIIISTTDACPASAKWLSMMAQGFTRGEIVLGYCGFEPQKGFTSWLMRTERMMNSVAWLSSAIRRMPYRGIRHNLGFTKRIYFSSNGFSHLNMNIGEDDLYMQRIMTRDNVSVILSPRAATVEHPWGGFGWWLNRRRHYESALPFYPDFAKSHIRWEICSRVLLFAAIATAAIVMPIEFGGAAIALLLMRYLAVALAIRKIAKRLGERRMVRWYFIYDLISPVVDLLVRISLLHKDGTVWR